MNTEKMYEDLVTAIRREIAAEILVDSPTEKRKRDKKVAGWFASPNSNPYPAMARKLPNARLVRLPSPNSKRTPRAKLKATPKARRAWKLQGQYIGALRRLDKNGQRRVKDMRKAKGVTAALKLAGKL